MSVNPDTAIVSSGGQQTSYNVIGLNLAGNNFVGQLDSEVQFSNDVLPICFNMGLGGLPSSVSEMDFISGLVSGNLCDGQ